MNLYYEDAPASEHDDPQLPPLLDAEKIAIGTDVMAKAIGRAAAGETGLVCYSEATHCLDMAITLAPEVSLSKAMQMHYTLMTALGDSIGALAPPEVGVRYRFPRAILFNRGHAGVVRVAAAPCQDPSADIPDWLVVSAQLRLTFDRDDHSHDYRMANTSLEEEGGGFISRTRLVESVSRHFLVWLHKWEEEGFRPIHETWLKRVDDDKALTLKDGRVANFLGLDEEGGALVTVDGRPETITLHNSAGYFNHAPLDELASGSGR